MASDLSKSDWKYLRSIENDLLSKLCQRINEEAAEILTSKLESEHKKYLALHKHVQVSNKLVADCFNDWRPSTLWYILPLLRKHKLLSDEHLARLSDDAHQLLDRLGLLALPVTSGSSRE